MRLWHIDLIPYLPVSQLKGQWRELNSIFKKQDKHILINYVYNYDKNYLYHYSMAVMLEMAKRKIAIRNITNFDTYFHALAWEDTKYAKKFKEHNDEYLTICYWNLREKYIRGQKDFTDDIWEKLDKFYKEEIK